MLMLTGEGVGMALAHDLSYLLTTVTFYSLATPHYQYQDQKYTNIHLLSMGAILVEYLLAFIFFLRNSTILCLNYS